VGFEGGGQYWVQSNEGGLRNGMNRRGLVPVVAILIQSSTFAIVHERKTLIIYSPRWEPSFSLVSPAAYNHWNGRPSITIFACAT